MRIRDWLLAFAFVLLLSVDGWGSADTYIVDTHDHGIIPLIALGSAFLWAMSVSGGKRDNRRP